MYQIVRAGVLSPTTKRYGRLRPTERPTSRPTARPTERRGPLEETHDFLFDLVLDVDRGRTSAATTSDVWRLARQGQPLCSRADIMMAEHVQTPVERLHTTHIVTPGDPGERPRCQTIAEHFRRSCPKRAPGAEIRRAFDPNWLCWAKFGHVLAEVHRKLANSNLVDVEMLVEFGHDMADVNQNWALFVKVWPRLAKRAMVWPKSANIGQVWSSVGHQKTRLLST